MNACRQLVFTSIEILSFLAMASPPEVPRFIEEEK